MSLRMRLLYEVPLFASAAHAKMVTMLFVSYDADVSVNSTSIQGANIMRQQRYYITATDTDKVHYSRQPCTDGGTSSCYQTIHTTTECVDKHCYIKHTRRDNTYY